jgi:hypothetical protein
LTGTRSHNVPVSRRLSWVLAALLLIGTVGCSDDGDDSGSSDATSESPTATGPSVAVPAGLTLTDPGSTLDLGQPASVVYDAGPQRVSVLTVTVQKVVVGSMAKDFKNFVLGPKELKSTPYYATATVRNAGPGALDRASVPLYGHDSTNTVFPATTLVGELDACPGGPLPESFGPKATQRTCLVFLVGADVTLDAIELRPAEGFDAISWPVPDSVPPADPPKSPADKSPADKSPG